MPGFIDEIYHNLKEKKEDNSGKQDQKGCQFCQDKEICFSSAVVSPQLPPYPGVFQVKLLNSGSFLGVKNLLLFHTSDYPPENPLSSSTSPTRGLINPSNSLKTTIPSFPCCQKQPMRD